MSSTESSGAPAEAAATTQPAGVPAAAPSFGTSRGSGLARGKRPVTGHAPAASAKPSEYTPTAIEIINAPREYQNPFAPASGEVAETAGTHEAPAQSEAAPAAPAAEAPPAAPTVEAAPAIEPSAEAVQESAGETQAGEEAKAELNILPPERQRAVAPQTWDSENFRPAAPRERERRPDRAPRAESGDEQPIPSKFRYERAKDGPLPPRPAPVSPPAPAAPKSGGLVAWLKSFFGSKAPETPTAPQNGELRGEGREGGRRRHRHRGGRGRGQFHGQGGGGQGQAGGENRGQGGDYGERRGGGGFRRRRRGGRGHGRDSFGGQHHEGGRPAGPSAT